MLRRIGERSAAIAQRYMPDPIIFAIFLTFLVYLMGLFLTGGKNNAFDMVRYWYGGFWNLLAFSMQMVLILVTGYCLAMAPSVNRVLRRLSSMPKSAGSGILLVTFSALIASWINWGLGLIVGAIMAREVATQARMRGIKLHFPLAAAGAYVGNVVWHGGLSGSAPLAVNTAKHVLEGKIGLIPNSQTIFTTFNLVTIGITILVLPFVLRAMHPRDEDVVEIDNSMMPAIKGGADAAEARVPAVAQTPAERLENSRIVVWLVCLMGFSFIGWWFWTRGLDLNLDIVNFTFLMLGLLAHGTPASYVRAVVEAVRTTGGIVLQFPFYAGIMGMMTASGLVTVIAGWFVAISTPATYYFWTLVSASLVNLAVPSGGGQWAVQGPIVVEAAQQLGANLPRSIMALAYGDQLTNMLQPFWALPILALTKLKAGDVMGYTAIAMVVAFVFYAVGLTFIP